VKEMTEPIFQDKKLEIYKDFVIIKDYYAPRGTFRRWFPFHLGREAKDKALVIRRKSGLIKAIKITLDTEDPVKACGLLYNLLH